MSAGTGPVAAPAAAPPSSEDGGEALVGCLLLSFKQGKQGNSGECREGGVRGGARRDSRLVFRWGVGVAAAAVRGLLVLPPPLPGDAADSVLSWCGLGTGQWVPDEVSPGAPCCVGPMEDGEWWLPRPPTLPLPGDDSPKEFGDIWGFVCGNGLSYCVRLLT